MGAVAMAIAKVLSPGEIDRLHTRSDCFISLTRSKGWGLSPFDATLFGNPVVITGWGGQLNYLGDEYAYLVRCTMEETAKSPPDGYYLQSKDALWARADRAHASKLMRFVFENREAAKDIAQDVQSSIRARYGAERISRRFAPLMGVDVNG